MTKLQAEQPRNRRSIRGKAKTDLSPPKRLFRLCDTANGQQALAPWKLRLYYIYLKSDHTKSRIIYRFLLYAHCVSPNHTNVAKHRDFIHLHTQYSNMTTVLQ